ncbi:MAG: hypothetical protein IKE31_01855 [Eubacterium sp.]|nr:hypothetical protein [Eubacterium sp.]
MKNTQITKLLGTMLLTGVLAGSMLLAGCGNMEAAVDAAVETALAGPGETGNAEVTAESGISGETDETAESADSAGTGKSKEAADGEKSKKGSDTMAVSGSEDDGEGSSTKTIEETDPVTGGTFEDDSDGGHAIEADAVKASYSDVTVQKTGEADGDEADFYGENAAVFATNGADLTLSDISVTSDGTHANGVFSYGEGTTVNISDSTIETSGNCSGGIMVTGGGTLNADNLTVHTTGNSSAAIRSDRGGGTENVTGGTYTTDGTGSPAIYSTAEVTVTDAELTSTASQGVVVEGKNSVTLNDVTLTADNNTKNSDKSDWYQAVMIYQSMSGDAAEGEASFSMNGGSLINKNGDIFFVNNTVATIDLENAEIINEDEDGLFLRAAAAGWGSEGSNGGHVTLNAIDQVINGDIAVDDVSSLNLYLSGTSVLTGAIDLESTAEETEEASEEATETSESANGAEAVAEEPASGSGNGEAYVEIAEKASWVLTGDSYITSLTCDEDAIDLNGYALYVNGEVYKEGTASEGEAVEVKIVSGSGMGERPDAPPADMHGPNDEGHGPGGNEHRPGEKGHGPDGSSGERPDAPPAGMDGPGGPEESTEASAEQSDI